MEIWYDIRCYDGNAQISSSVTEDIYNTMLKINYCIISIYVRFHLQYPHVNYFSPYTKFGHSILRYCIWFSLEVIHHFLYAKHLFYKWNVIFSTSYAFRNITHSLSCCETMFCVIKGYMEIPYENTIIS